mgnify:CR=1 FL=1
MIILFGSTGYIGSEFKRQLEELKLPFFCWPNTSKTTFADLEKWYDEAGYPMIGYAINAAGYTGKPNVDACENDKGEYSVFVELPRSPKLAEQIKDITYGVKKLTGIDDFKFKYYKLLPISKNINRKW